MSDSTVNAHGYSIRQLFLGECFRFDYYQREYTWEREDVALLLSDLSRRFLRGWRPNHDRKQINSYPSFFLGTYVYYKSDGATYLIDGQQRITTIHLLLIHLRKLLLDQDLKDDADSLHKLVCDYRQGEWTFTVDVPERSELMKALLTGEQPTHSLDDSPSVANIRARSLNLDELFPEEIRREPLRYFCDWLISRVTLVGIEAANKEQGQEIFELINDRGQRPSAIDLLKGFLLKEAEGHQDELNGKWRDMLSSLLALDRNAPSEFIKTLLTARYANLSADSHDSKLIEIAFHEWIRGQYEALGLAKPSDFARFVESIVRMSGHYSRLVSAARYPVLGLEELFYNAVNGLEDQMYLVLATIKDDDHPEVVNAKARLVAAYIDVCYVRLHVNNETLNMEGEVSRIVPQLRECGDLDAIRSVLGREVSRLPDLSPLMEYRLQANNRRQVRYLLARMTAFIQRGCGHPDEIGSYLNSKNPYEIEHIWADHYERYRAEVSAGEFQSWRNRFGALLLLDKATNASFNDSVYGAKLAHYYSKTRLAASLSPLSYKKSGGNTKFLRFIDSIGLSSLFKAFPDTFGRHAIDSRQQLYRAICGIIWDPNSLGFEVSDGSTLAPSPPSSTRRYGVSVRDLIEAGLIQPGAPLKGKRRGKEFSAIVEHDGRIRVSEQQIYRSLSAAGEAVLDRQSCNGWVFWTVETTDGWLPIKTIRDNALNRGLIE